MLGTGYRVLATDCGVLATDCGVLATGCGVDCCFVREKDREDFREIRQELYRDYGIMIQLVM